MNVQLHAHLRFISAYKRYGRGLEQYAYLLGGNAQLAKVVAVMVVTNYLFEHKPGTRGKGSKKKYLMEQARLKCKALGFVKSTQFSAGKVVPIFRHKKLTRIEDVLKMN